MHDSLLIDEPSKIRQGEEINTEDLIEYLKKHISPAISQIEIKQFPSGFSNLTYLIKLNGKEYILRRPPFGKKAKTAHDMKREYTILSAIHPLFQYSPEPVLYCDDETIIGAQFYIMERIKGIILRKDLPSGVVLSRKEARKLSENLISILATLHSIKYEETPLKDIAHPKGYVTRQIEGWSNRYRDAKTPDAPDFEEIMQWLAEKNPGDSQYISLIHNDYKFDNAVLKEDNITEIIGILDWEMATIGDPFMDIGSSLAYWIEKKDPPQLQAIRQMPTHIDGMLTRREQFDLYCRLTNRESNNFDFYYCFGLFRLAVIAQQIYYRFFHGQTSDPRFKPLVSYVKILENTALDLIKKSDI
jgi:aminoglycoside phosphotransferase (APT) family kinase protein